MERKDKEMYYRLALSYFNGNLPLDKEKLLYNFIASDTAHERLFRQWETEWMASPESERAVACEWNEFQHRLRVRNAIAGTFDVPRSNLRKITAIAAAILLLVMGSAALWYKLSVKEPPFYSFVTAPGEKCKVVLTDGSSVWLNAKSKLRYSQNFNAHNREVLLEGEAYFEINKQKGNTPFRVKTAHYDILVKGTKFNIISYGEDPVSTVTLLEGAVDVIYDHKNIPMEPGESLSFKKEAHRFFRHNVQAYQARSWVDGKVEYDEITLNELAVRLSRKYNVNIYLDDNLEKEAVFKVSLRNEETIDQFLQALSKIIEIRFERRDREIYIMKQ